MDSSFFTTEDGVWFSPTEHARGPWDANHCHAGPPSGLAARALEQLVPETRLTRLTIDLIRPIPHAGFSVHAELTRKGRSVSTGSGYITDADGVVCANFNGMLMAPMPALPEIEQLTPHCGIGNPDDAVAGSFPLQETAHGLASFKDAIEVRYPVGQSPTVGPTKYWMRTPPLLPDEVGSGFQRISPLSDCGNAFSRNAEPWKPVTFANADLTVVLHREPQGEWLGATSVSNWEPDGIGMAEAQLFDRNGSVGFAIQMLALRAPTA